MIEKQLSNSGELGRGVFEPFYGKYAENKIRDKIVSGVETPEEFPEDLRAEFSVYDGEKNLQHWARWKEVSVFDHIKEAGIPDGGQYIFRYNFFDPSFGSPDGSSLYVQSISSDRQEIRARPTPESGEQFQNRFINFFRARFQLPGYTNFPNYTKTRQSASEREKVEPLRKVVNFGDNLYYHVLNWTNVVETDEDGLVEFQENGLPVFKKAVIIRIKEELPDGIEVGDEFWIDSEFARPYIDRFEIFRRSEATPVNKLSGPDFSTNLSEARRGRESGFENFEDIANTNTFETSESFLERKISVSEKVKLNVDYTEFENFVHFSSIERRLENFRFKIETINQKTDELSDLSGGVQSAGRQETIKRQIEELIGSFDAYEQWLFRSESDRSYPKKPSGALYPPDSMEVNHWFDEILSEARKYDDRNDSALRKQVPEFVREDPENEDFVLFVDMVGHWFDVNWIYIDHLEHLTDQTEDAFDKETLSSELSRVVGESMGLETHNGFDAEEFFDEVFDSKKIDDIFDSAGVSRPDQPEVEGAKIGYTRYQAQQQIWRRLLSNLTHYYKTRGSKTSIKLLTSIFGIPSESLVIRESGGTSLAQSSSKNKGSFPLTETSHYLPFVSSQSIEIPWNVSNNFSAPTEFDSIFSAFEEWPKSIEFRFRSEYQGGVPIKLFDITGTASLRIERTDLDGNEGKLVLEVREADGTRIEAESEAIPFFNGEWTNVLFQMRENQPFFDVFVQQRSPFGNFSDRDQLSLKIDLETALNFFTAQAIHFGENLNTQQFQKGTPFIGDLDQINLWQETLSGDQFDKHSLAPKRKGVDNSQLAEKMSAFDEDLDFLRRDLYFRADFPVPQNLSKNQKIENESSLESTEDLEGIAIGFSSANDKSPLERYERINFFDPVQVGATSHFNSKIRVEDSSLDKPLRSDRSVENRKTELITKDRSRVGIFFSPFTSANRDVISEIGIGDINSVLGNPNDQFETDYYLLDGMSRMYWNKYDRPVDVQKYIQYIDQFYDAFFDHIENSVPARSSLASGVVIEPTVLERDREPVPTGSSEVEDLAASVSVGAEASVEPTGSSL